VIEDDKKILLALDGLPTPIGVLRTRMKLYDGADSMSFIDSLDRLKGQGLIEFTDQDEKIIKKTTKGKKKTERIQALLVYEPTA